MKRSLPLLLLLVLALSSCDLSSLQFFDGEPASEEKNTFVIESDGSSPPPSSFTLLLTADQHFMRRESGVYYENDLFFNWVDTYQEENSSAAEHLDLMISMGDITENSKREEFELFKEYKNSLAEKGIVTYAVRGNHDIRPGSEHISHWKTYVSAYSYQAFSHKGVSFYLLNTASRTLGRIQWQQLQKAVEGDGQAKIFFSHVPLYGKPSLIYLVLSDIQERDAIIRLMRENKAALYLAGHYHHGDVLHTFNEGTSEFILGAFHGRNSLVETTKPRWYLLHFRVEEKTITLVRYQVEEDRTITETTMAILIIEL